MDCKMPNKDGYQTTKEIIEKYGDKRPVILALSAGVTVEEKQRCIEIGMDDFLSKPITLAKLTEKLKKYA